jgi:thiol:disulfide interchange protein
MVLLLLPATGNVRRGLPEGAAGRSRAGSILGYTVAGVLAAFIVCVGLATFRHGPVEPAPAASVPLTAGIEWIDYGTGLEKAGAEGKPVLLNFFADWCPYCKKMDRSTFRDPAVVEFLDGFVPVRIDSEGTESVHGYRGTDLAVRFGVATLPTLVLLDSRGNEISRSRGYHDARRLVTWLEGSLR